MNIEKKLDTLASQPLVLVEEEKKLVQYKPIPLISKIDELFFSKWYNSPLFLAVFFLFIVMINLLVFIYTVQPIFLNNINNQFDNEFAKNTNYINNSLNNSIEIFSSINEKSNQNAYQSCNIFTLAEQDLQNTTIVFENINQFNIDQNNSIKSSIFSDNQINQYLEDVNKISADNANKITLANNHIGLIIEVNNLKSIYNEICLKFNEVSLSNSYDNTPDCNQISTILDRIDVLNNRYLNFKITSIQSSINERFSFCNTATIIDTTNLTASESIFQNEFEFINSLAIKGDVSNYYTIEDEFNIQMDDIYQQKEDYFENRQKYKFYFLNI